MIQRQVCELQGVSTNFWINPRMYKRRTKVNECTEGALRYIQGANYGKGMYRGHAKKYTKGALR